MARCTRLENMFIPRGVTWRGVAELRGKPLTAIVMNRVGGSEGVTEKGVEALEAALPKVGGS